MKLNVLGTDYDFRITTEREEPGLYHKAGYCDAYSKEIVIEDDYLTNNADSIKDIGAFKRKVKRHELIHAFLWESGLNEYAENEQFVDWIAWQFPKMLQAFKDVEAI